MAFSNSWANGNKFIFRIKYYILNTAECYQFIEFGTLFLLTHIAANQVEKQANKGFSFFLNSGLCTTYFLLVNGLGMILRGVWIFFNCSVGSVIGA